MRRPVGRATWATATGIALAGCLGDYDVRDGAGRADAATPDGAVPGAEAAGADATGGDAGAPDGGGGAPADGGSGAGGASGAGTGGAAGSDGDGSAGAPGDAGDGAETDAGACPGGKGPLMVDVGGFCIDQTEVTGQQYAQFYGDPKKPAFEGACAWKDADGGGGASPGAWVGPSYPVTDVDWCDAWAFCKWAGKRLCGAVGTGPANYNDQTNGQWYVACSQGPVKSKYPYGSAYDKTKCNGPDYQTPKNILPVKAALGCHGQTAPWAGVWDMSGNVSEWIDACSGNTGKADTCRQRGGSWDESAPTYKDLAACDGDDNDYRNGKGAWAGFRCCAP